MNPAGPIDRATARRRLAARYADQCERFPSMRQNLPLRLYLARNLAAVMRRGLLASYDAR